VTGLPDRRVHAEHPDGRQVVRYDRAGTWKLHDPNRVPTARGRGMERPMTLEQAVAFASAPGWTWLPGVPGGIQLDRRARKSQEAAK
jgi:hypothetical protein